MTPKKASAKSAKKATSKTPKKSKAVLRIVLIGFMGAGKTFTAESLAKKLACEWIDLDEFIEANENRSVAKIFENLGESVFREIETEALKEVLSNEILQVVALGGGTWTIEENRANLRKHKCTIVWLDAPFELCWQRISVTGSARPLARAEKAARKLFDERRAAYAQADWRIEINAEQTAEDVAVQILNQFVKPNKPAKRKN